MTTCDVLVVGAGVAGCSLAYELAGAGASVVVAERGAVCSGSSALNAGGIRQQFSQESSIRAAMATVRLLGHFREEFGVDPVFRQAGYLFLHDGGANAKVFERAVALQNSCGVPTRVVDLDEVRRLVPGINVDDLAGAVYNPTDGYVDPNSVVAGLAAGAKARGATILQDSAVEAMEMRGGKVTGVTTRRESIAPDIVVNAAGAWSASIARLYGGSVPIAARRSDIFVLDRSPSPDAYLPLTIDLVLGQYFHSEGDGLVAGLGEAPMLDDPPAEIATGWDALPKLVERLVHRLPGMESAGVSHGWSGLIEPTPDDNPIVGWTHLENVYTFAGFSGHGMCLSPGLAPHAAREIRGGTPELSLDIYRLDRFERGGVEPEGVWGGSGIADGTSRRSAPAAQA
jgi:sarcosine oxidase subunit beta